MLLAAFGDGGAVQALADTPRVDIFEVQELAVNRGQTEALLLDLVGQCNSALPVQALAALARMPSPRARRSLQMRT
jgi:hypothetical protein